MGIPTSMFAPGKTVIDPACGDGQFLVAVKWLKVIEFNMSQDEALEDIYGVDIMRDNVDLCKKRLEGGNIVMGNTMEPNIRLDEQTDEEYRVDEKMVWCSTVEFFGMISYKYGSHLMDMSNYPLFVDMRKPKVDVHLQISHQQTLGELWSSNTSEKKLF